jgi:hypothetical protein
LSATELTRDGDAAHERDIVATWGEWYDGALTATTDIEVGGSSTETRVAIDKARAAVKAEVARLLATLGAPGAPKDR